MSSTLEAIKEAALALPEPERAELADFMYDLVDAPPSGKLHPDWYAVAQERFDEFLSGRAVGIPAEEVMKKLRRVIDEASRVS